MRLPSGARGFESRRLRCNHHARYILPQGKLYFLRRGYIVHRITVNPQGSDGLIRAGILFALN